MKIKIINMDYKERMAQFCDKQCSDRNECEYKACNKTFRCDYLSGIMYGWELGQQDTLEEIENAINEFDEDDPIFSYYIAVVDKIQELKR